MVTVRRLAVWGNRRGLTRRLAGVSPPRHERLELDGLHIELLRVPCRRDQDRIGAGKLRDRVIVALADGAGGMAHGDRAASLACDRALSRVMDEDALRLLDDEVARLGGETTLVTASIERRGSELFDVDGVSVGDSRAFARTSDGWIELAERQDRRRLGSRRVRGERFVARADRLIVVSDGMLDLVGVAALCEAETLAAFAEPVPRHDDASCVLTRIRSTV